jgi:ABC-type antimicrobial peptide transport system permease subunit
MIRNYLKAAWRNLTKNKISSFVNIGGLAVGMAVAMLIGLWIKDELSFNKTYPKYDRLAQLIREETVNGEKYIADNNNNFPIPLAAELRDNYGSYFKNVALVSDNNEHILSSGEFQFSRRGIFAEPGFTEMFTMKMLSGTSSNSNDPNSILINASLANSLFGKKEAVGKIIKIDNFQSIKVVGVFEDLPYNSRFSDVSFLCPWSYLINTSNYVKGIKDDWGNSSFKIFTETVPGVSMKTISARIREIYWARIKNEQPNSNNFSVALLLHPMKNWHLRSEWKNGVQAGGRIQMVWMFAAIGIFVLLLACINFMNLSTARSEKRAREVGVRKAIGSLRGQLVKQFLSESFVVVIFAFVVAIGLVIISLNGFNQIADKRIDFPFSSPWFWIASVAFIFITSFISGSYPAFYLSSFRPVKVLKGTFRVGSFAALPRRIMVALQFTISISLIIGTIVVYRQIKHGQDRPIGYDRSRLISINMNTPDLFGKYDVLRNELLGSGGAVGFAQSTSTTTHINDFDGRFEWEGKDPALPQMSFAVAAVTVDFGKTIGWQFADGRDFSRAFAGDSAGIVVNEAALKFMNLKNPVGKTLKWAGKQYTIIGVIKDMITESPYAQVQQGAFIMIPGVGPNILVKLNPKLSMATAISRIEPIFRKLNPASPFEYKFIDEEYGRKFASEQRIGTLAGLFAALAIFISCLGIFGLASFVAEQRTREIGVRKILGASVLNLWGLLSKEFIILVAIAFVLASPIAWYFMHEWLQQYQYRTEVSWWIFAVTACSVLVITLLTVSYQSVKAAMTNPVKSLRTE